ncbi:MAG: DUF4359 domain-containing protein, partial [Synechococcaceae cyanobacterium SM2_3_1]|nr:DUF4359 domain-containing protein [Synechococcaceae cyanobacterium SM2_3_1]
MAIVKVIATGLGIGVVGVGVAAAMTNPSPEEYQAYAVEALSAYARQEVCSQQEPSFLQKGCEMMIQTLQPTLHDVLLAIPNGGILFSSALRLLDISPVQITPLSPNADLPATTLQPWRRSSS